MFLFFRMQEKRIIKNYSQCFYTLNLSKFTLQLPSTSIMSESTIRFAQNITTWIFSRSNFLSLPSNAIVLLGRSFHKENSKCMWKSQVLCGSPLVSSFIQIYSPYCTLHFREHLVSNVWTGSSRDPKEIFFKRGGSLGFILTVKAGNLAFTSSDSWGKDKLNPFGNLHFH